MRDTGGVRSKTNCLVCFIVILIQRFRRLVVTSTDVRKLSISSSCSIIVDRIVYTLPVFNAPGPVDADIHRNLGQQ